MRIPTQIWRRLVGTAENQPPLPGDNPNQPPHVVRTRRSGSVIPYSASLGMPAQLWSVRIGSNLKPGDGVRILASSPQGLFPPQESTFVVSASDAGGEVVGVVTLPALLPAEIRCQLVGEGNLTSEPYPILPDPEAVLEERQVHFQSVLDKVEFPSFKFVCGLSGGSLFLVISCDGTCNVTGAPMRWRSGKWLLSQHMMDSEIVQKALKATITAIEHEARENFLYRGRAVFDPHYDIDKLWELRGESDAVVQRLHAGAVR